MNGFYSRTVFFVNDADAALNYYTCVLGFSRDWVHSESDRAIVGQVSLHGFELILNHSDGSTDHRVGAGRVFIGLENEQVELFRSHIAAHEIATTQIDWGRPTTVISDQDGNEIFFWMP